MTDCNSQNPCLLFKDLWPGGAITKSVTELTFFPNVDCKNVLLTDTYRAVQERVRVDRIGLFPIVCRISYTRNSTELADGVSKVHTHMVAVAMPVAPGIFDLFAWSGHELKAETKSFSSMHWSRG